MKKGKFLILIFAVLINICCGNKSFDLSSVSLGEDAKKYDFENKNLFLKDSGSNPDVVQYYADENKGLTYSSIPLDNTMGTRITIFKGKVGAIDTNAAEKYSLEFVEKITAKHGKPTATVTDKATVDAKLVKPIFEKLKKISPDKVSWNQGEKNSFTYPTSFFWDDGKNYSILSISIEDDGTIRNKYVTVTKDAYRNNAVFGLKYPTPQGSPWYNYMK
ncbi:hypothetical protein SAMN05421866_1113 [Chryseobacterium oranimense]|uniref:Uncharacterized protein n=1 Tax=Chryseobacterium oranimense TaxID=421058 RepID=A0A1M5LJ70_9FLAO|nr:hypothetical protein [Chryseobacterium oranimense]SHG65091.1 hypothetical protein SAMN05421866_1113 [Chryseobacterium oranimense]